MFSYRTLEERIPNRHPLREIRKIADKAIAELAPTFDAMYATTGRPSIPPEHLIRAMLIQVLYSVRSERLLMEELDFNLLFRWFVGLSMDAEVWNHSVFSKNRDRLLAHDVADRFFDAIRNQAAAKKLLSRDHFTIDGTLIEASASLKSFKPKSESSNDDESRPGDGGGRNEMVDFKGETRSNSTHESTTDPDARLARKGNGKEAKLSYAGHLMTENRNGLIVDAELTQATGMAERDAGLAMIARMPGVGRKTLGGDKGYDTKPFVEGARAHNVTPHVAAKKYTAIDGRTSRHDGYAMSQQRRKLVEERFGWLKDIGGLRKLKHRGLAKVSWIFKFAAAACNIVLMRRLLEAA
ncbi:MAG: IS5 family transposase [Planctomycetes bacterium]|nr:IS5 family transposase [Planctomycetota bacterium]